MSKDNLIKAFSRTVPAAPEKARPELTFSDKMTLHFNGEAVMVFHVDNAHTDGDAMVYFANSNILHMGDTYFNGRYPYIDLSSGGSVDGLLNAINTAIMIVDGDTKIIPGHGNLSNKKELLKYREVVLTVRDRVKAAIKEGKSLEEIKAAKLNADYDEAWGSGFINGERIVDIMYTSLTTEMGIEEETKKEEEKK
jgi:glyoxylase-like metal-dependent hydrolase (beta-lactamase superfamily II)